MNTIDTRKPYLKRPFKEKNSNEKKFKFCLVCGLGYKRSNDFKHRLTNKRPAANKKYDCQQCEIAAYLTDEKYLLETADHTNRKTMSICEICDKNTFNIYLSIFSY